MIETALFYFFALLTVAGGIATVTRRSAVLAAVWLTVSLLGVAGLFLLLGAEFLFVAQIIIYIGGITLLFLFVIMLVNLEAASHLRQFRRGWPLFACVGIALATELILLLRRGSAFSFPPLSTAPQLGNSYAIADALLSQQFVAFELISVLLLVAIVGSVWMGQQRKRAAGEGQT
jgi:NADH-quinone oxidoreductase subunit J